MGPEKPSDPCALPKGTPERRSEEHTSELQSLPTRRSSDLQCDVEVGQHDLDKHDAERHDKVGCDAAPLVQAEWCVLLQWVGRTEEAIRIELEWVRKNLRILVPFPKAHPKEDRKSTRLNSSHSLHDALPISSAMSKSVSTISTNMMLSATTKSAAMQRRLSRPNGAYCSSG